MPLGTGRIDLDHETLDSCDCLRHRVVELLSLHKAPPDVVPTWPNDETPNCYLNAKAAHPGKATTTAGPPLHPVGYGGSLVRTDQTLAIYPAMRTLGEYISQSEGER